MCRKTVSSSKVSRAVAEFDVILEALKKHPIGEMAYLILDARNEKVRHEGQIQYVVILIAVGVDTMGKRCILSVSASPVEHESTGGSSWRKPI